MAMHFDARRTIRLSAALLLAAGLTPLLAAADPPAPRDLAPVTRLEPPSHPPVELVKDGAARGVIFVAEATPRPYLRILLDELVEVVRLRTGATLDYTQTPPTAEQTAIVVGDCAESRAAGIDAAQLPVEGFVIRTAARRVYLVGSTQALPPGSTPWAPWDNEATAWAVADFLERCVGVRWYWPTALGGRCLDPDPSLVVPPLAYRDQPAYRQREFHPRNGWKLPTIPRYFDKEPLPFAAGAIPAGVQAIDLTAYLPLLRSGNSWPYHVKVHEPQKMWKQWDAKWAKLPETHEMFQQKQDGTPDARMFCYSSPRTLEYLLQGCADTWDGKKPASWVTATCVTISPGDFQLTCRCKACQEVLAGKGGGSLLMGRFVKRMCEEVQKRWPGKKVIFLPYQNYQRCPEGVEFPDNLEVMCCCTGGPMALMIQPQSRAKTEANLRDWSATLGGRPITSWDYSDRGSGWTFGPVQYPHLVRDFYDANRTLLVGTYINGGMASDWTTSAPTMYVWMKSLWNPDLDVDAVLDEMCRRLYGKAAAPARDLLRLQCEAWATLRGGLSDQGKISPAKFKAIWPAETVAEMRALRDKALAGLAGDPLGRQRFLYWTWTFDAFLAESVAIQDTRATPAGKTP